MKLFSLSGFTVAAFLVFTAVAVGQDKRPSTPEEWSAELLKAFEQSGGYHAIYAAENRKDEKSFRGEIVALADRSQVWIQAVMQADGGAVNLCFLADNKADICFVLSEGVCERAVTGMSTIVSEGMEIARIIDPDIEIDFKGLKWLPSCYLDKNSLNCQISLQPNSRSLWDQSLLNEALSVSVWPGSVEFKTAKAGRIRIDRDSGFMQSQIFDNEEGQRRSLKLVKVRTNLEDDELLQLRPKLPEKRPDTVNIVATDDGLLLLLKLSFLNAARQLVDGEVTWVELDKSLGEAGRQLGTKFAEHPRLERMLRSTMDGSEFAQSLESIYEKMGESGLVRVFTQILREKFGAMKEWTTALELEKVPNAKVTVGCFTTFYAHYMASWWVEQTGKNLEGKAAELPVE